ncbi:sulfatase-like hydrolase/transferase, partial [Escherichia sp. SS-MK2]
HPDRPAVETRRWIADRRYKPVHGFHFNQAISGAPYTALSVPLSLTADSVLSHDIHNYPDNIINMANQAGFQTFWLSSQSAFRQNGTAVTSIAMRAMETVYV